VTPESEECSQCISESFDCGDVTALALQDGSLDVKFKNDGSDDSLRQLVFGCTMVALFAPRLSHATIVDNKRETIV